MLLSYPIFFKLLFYFEGEREGGMADDYVVRSIRSVVKL